MEPIVAAHRANGALPETAAAAEYLLDKLVWGVTTLTDGPRNARWDTQFVSEGAKVLYEELERAALQRRLTEVGKRLLPQLRHEHVVPRTFLVEKLLAGDTTWSLASALACVVTESEHGRLPVAPAGWDRYRAAGVRVWNRAGEGSWLWE